MCAPHRDLKDLVKEEPKQIKMTTVVVKDVTPRPKQIEAEWHPTEPEWRPYDGN